MRENILHFLGNREQPTWAGEIAVRSTAAGERWTRPEAYTVSLVHAEEPEGLVDLQRLVNVIVCAVDPSTEDLELAVGRHMDGHGPTHGGPLSFDGLPFAAGIGTGERGGCTCGCYAVGLAARRSAQLAVASVAAD